MTTPLRALLIEDSEDDALLILRELRKGQFELVHHRVATRSAMEAALKGKDWDLIICDHFMPTFNSEQALELVRSLDLDLPFIIVSGAAPEEVVTASMRLGAHDFISKNSLVRLVPAVQRELRDVAARKERTQMASRLAESEVRYANLFTGNPAPILLIDAATLLVVDANPAAEAFFGYSLETLRRVSIQALSSSVRSSGWRDVQRQKDQRAHQFSDTLRLADGSTKDVDVLAVKVPQGGRTLLSTTLIDQTQRRHAERGMTRLAAAVEQVMDAIAITDATGDILYANEAFGRLLELDPIMENQSLINLVGGQAVLQGFQQTVQGMAWKGRFSLKTVTGVQKELDVSLSPVREAVDSTPNVVAVIRDITKEKELSQQLRQVQKMDALGALAAGIAHDFNNVLTTILSASELVKWQLPPNSPLLPKVDAILHAGLCASGLNKQILAFSHKSDDIRLPLDFTNVVRDALHMLKATMPSNIDIRSELTSGVWVEGDPTQLHQVVLNLSINAFQAMQPRGGMLSITLSERGANDPSLPLGLRDFRCALLTVEDSGCGIDAQIQERVFEPFFTTKPSGEGTGLGLSMVHATITKLGGIIRLLSEPGRGTTFHIYLPCVTGKERPVSSELREDVGGNERLLFVDDEELLTALAKQGLQNQGYQVTTITKPLDALEAFRRHPDAYDLVLTDLAMPDMGGAELASHMQELRPDLPVLLVTGMPPSTALSTNVKATFCGVVPKPFTGFDLAKAVRKALASVPKKPVQIPINESEKVSIPEPHHESRKSSDLILLADDSNTTRSMLRSWLEHAGYSVQIAKDGLEAWDAFSSGPSSGKFSLLLTDVVMPRMDGLELSRLVRKSDPSIPIAVLTSNEDKETVKSALHLGVNEFLNKPFEKADILDCVANLLRERSTRLDARRSAETAQAVRLAQRVLVATPEKDMPLFSLFEPLTDAGGDVFRCLRCEDDSIFFILADVAGHSVISSYAVASFLAMLSAFMSECRHLRPSQRKDEAEKGVLHNCAQFGRVQCEPLSHLAMKFNRSIQEGPFSEVPVCVLMGQWKPETGRLHLLNAGIPHGLITRKDSGKTSHIVVNGTPLGIFPQPMVEERVIQLREGDRLLFGTDGFFDVRSSSDGLFEESSPRHWEALKDAPMDQSLSIICEAARNFGDGVIADDLLVIAFEQPPITKGHGITLHFPSNPQAIDAACERVRSFLENTAFTSGYGSEYLFDISMTLREALTNAIFHGNHEQPDAEVGLCCDIDLDHSKLVIRVVDEGTGFEFDSHEAPKDPLSERGRGIPLIRHYAQSAQMIGGELTMTFPLKEPIHENA